MVSGDTDAVTILFVDNNPDVVEACAASLGTDYEVLTATSGSEALELIDGTVDLVFLDRRMPEMSGDEVLSELRQRGHDMAVVMLTGVVPDVDIVDMPFDDYVKKPIDMAVLSRKIEVLTNRARFEEMSRHLYSLASKKASLEATGMNEKNSEEYQQLIDEMDSIRTELATVLEQLFGDEYDVTLDEV